MRTKANYTNKKFGLLTVMECLSESDGTNNGGLWLCKCKCSKLITLAGYTLHHRKSCGCLMKKAATQRAIGNRKPQELTITHEYRRYKGSLNKIEWLIIAQKPCKYCNSTDIRNRVLERSYKHSVILSDKDITSYQLAINDVIDGVSCCNRCKIMKNNLSDQEFMEHIKLIRSFVKD